MLRTALTFFLLAATLPLFSGACVLAWRASRAADGGTLASLYVPIYAARITVRREAGRLVLYGPPPPAPATVAQGQSRMAHLPAWSREWDGRLSELATPCGQLPAALAATVRNADLIWEVRRYHPKAMPLVPQLFSNRGSHPYYSPRGRPGSAIAQLAPYGPMLLVDGVTGHKMEIHGYPLPPYTLTQAARPLLAAMEDPDRWVAAHVALASISGDSTRAGQVLPYEADAEPAGDFDRVGTAEDHFVWRIDGMTAALRSARPEERRWERAGVQACEATIIPAQQRALIDQWHRRLDVPVISAALWEPVALTAVPSAGWCLLGLNRHLSRRRRTRTGRCPACGYDLRATPGHRPECGS